MVGSKPLFCIVTACLRYFLLPILQNLCNFLGQTKTFLLKHHSTAPSFCLIPPPMYNISSCCGHDGGSSPGSSNISSSNSISTEVIITIKQYVFKLESS